MSHKGHEINDVSADQAEIIQWRAGRRVELRNQYLKEIHSPDRPLAHLFDEQIFRQYATHMKKEDVYKARANHIIKFSFGIAGLFLCWKIVHDDRARKDNMYRTGQVSYRDREWKFC